MATPASAAIYEPIPHRVELAVLDQARRPPTETTRFITTSIIAGAAATTAGYMITVTDPENIMTSVYLRHLIQHYVGSVDITSHLTIQRAKSFAEHPGPADWYIFVPESIFSTEASLGEFCWELTAAIPNSLLG